LTILDLENWKETLVWESLDASTIILIMFGLTRWSNKWILTMFCSNSIENLISQTSYKNLKLTI
jgi:hypothetical protein